MLDVTGVGCPILFFTGIPCMGCGMTRACLALLRLDFSVAFSCHPLYFLLPALVIFVLFYDKIPKKPRNICLTAIIFLFIIVYLVRLCNPTDTIVKIHLSDGFFYRIANTILERRIT